MRPNLFLATIGRGSNGSNALEVTEDRAAVTAESQDNIINRVNNLSQYGPSWHYVPGIGVAGTAYAEVPGSALGDLAFTRASSKTRTNAAGVVETIAANVPPHDYRNADGSLSTFPRLNLEPQRTNSIRNSSMVGAVAGSPGTLPTNWLNLVTAGLTRTIVGTGTENGLPYVDIRFNGTANAASLRVDFDATTAIPALNAQVWTNSIYSKIVSAPNPAVSYALQMIERTSGGGFVTDGSQIFTPTTSIQRFAFTRTLNGGATVANVQPCITINLTNGATYDFTIRIAAPQMELGAYATTWIPTTTAAVLRLTDMASKTSVSSLIGQGQGTLYSEFNYRNTTSDPNGRIINVRTAASDVESILVLIFGLGAQANQLQVTTFTGGVSTIAVPASASTLITFGRHKIAVAYQGTSYVVYLDGILFATGTGAQASSMSVVEIGCTTVATRSLSNGISESALFKTRLTNAELAQLTTL